MESRNQIGQSSRDTERTRTISAPSRSEGVGNALRAAYDTATASLPDDMRNLLSRLG